MPRYIVLLRGVNVGGKNKIVMPQLKSALERVGFDNVVTYINSGNILLDSEWSDAAVRKICEAVIADEFALQIPSNVIEENVLHSALVQAPDWWNQDDDSKHNAIFVIAPANPEEILEHIGAIKPELERVECCGQVIFWSAPTATYGRSRLTKIVQDKSAYNAITIRNANTTLKLAALAKEKK